MRRWDRQPLFIFCIALTFCCSGPIASASGEADGAAGGKPLTWDACVARTLASNPNIRAAQFNSKRTASAVKVAKGARLPTLSLESSAAHAEGYEVEGGPTGMSTASMQPGDEASVSLQTRYDIYTGGRISAEIRGAAANQRQTDASLASTQHDVLCDLRRAFTRLLYAQELIQLSQAIEQHRKINNDLVKLRFEGGIEHKGSFLLSSALHEEALMETRQAVRSRRVAQLDMARLMGQGEPEGLCVTGSLEAAWGLASTNWAELAVSHPLSQERLAAFDVAQEDVARAKSKFRPTLSLVGSSSYYSDDSSLDPYRWRVAVVMSLPLFSGGQNVNTLAASEAGAQRAKEELRGVQEKVRAQMESALSLLIDARERVQAQRELLSAATIRAEISRQQYYSGLLRFENWDLIENDEIARQKQMLEALRNAMLADTDLRQALGSGDLP